jgi:ketosteroid isomerase-like protein
LSTEENKAITLQFYTEVWNNGRVELVDELIAPSFVNLGYSAKQGSDRESFKPTVSRIRDESEFRHTVEELIAERDALVARLRCHGETAAEGRRRGEPLTGREAAIWKLRNGQITGLGHGGRQLTHNRYSNTLRSSFSHALMPLRFPRRLTFSAIY